MHLSITTDSINVLFILSIKWRPLVTNTRIKKPKMQKVRKLSLLFSNFNLVLFILIALGIQAGGSALGQSLDRIPEKMAFSWNAPTIQEFDHFNFKLDHEAFTADMQDYRVIRSIKTLAEFEKVNRKKNLSKSEKTGTLLNLGYQYLRKSLELREKLIADYRQKLKMGTELNLNASQMPKFNDQSITLLRRKAVQSYRRLFNVNRKLTNNPRLNYNMGILQLALKNSNASLFLEKVIKKFGSIEFKVEN